MTEIDLLKQAFSRKQASKGWTFQGKVERSRAEVDAERFFVRWSADILKNTMCGTWLIINSKIMKVQSYGNDDGKTDGIIRLYFIKEIGLEYKDYNVEVRLKGFLNKHGETREYPEGWETKSLDSGIFINEFTLINHINEGFIYVVKIKNCDPRICFLTKDRIKELLGKSHRSQKSTNKKNDQSVKCIPLHWFIEQEKFIISKMIN